MNDSLLNSIFHILTGVGIFFSANWIGKHSIHFGYDSLTSITEPEANPGFNLIFRIVTPIVLLIIISAALYELNLDRFVENIHHSIAYYITIRLVFIIAVRRYTHLIPWPKVILQWSAIGWLSYKSYTNLISQKEYLFPDPKTLGNEMWLILIGYLYILSKEIGNEDSGKEKRARIYIKHRFEEICRKFGKQISDNSPNLKWEAIVYSIVIVEDFNRPPLYRLIERILFYFGRAKTLGIMQINTTRRITDEQSIKLGINYLKDIYQNTLHTSNWRLGLNARSYASLEETLSTEERNLIHSILVGYNPSGDYARSVEDVLISVESFLQVTNEDLIHPRNNPVGDFTPPHQKAQATAKINPPSPNTILEDFPKSEREVIIVTSEEEFLNAIAPNRTIEIQSNKIDLSKTVDRYMEFVRWAPTYDGSELIIRDVSNFEIRGSTALKPEIVTSSTNSIVLSFMNCKNVMLSNLTIGHEGMGDCTGGVTKFQSTSSIIINKCVLFGCGTEGLNLDKVDRFLFSNSEIRDCACGIMTIGSSENVFFLNSDFRNNQEYYGVRISDSLRVEFENCKFEKNTSCGQLFAVISSSLVRMHGGILDGNRATELGRIETLNVSLENAFEENSSTAME
jgi:hypothetical protein